MQRRAANFKPSRLFAAKIKEVLRINQKKKKKKQSSSDGKVKKRVSLSQADTLTARTRLTGHASPSAGAQSAYAGWASTTARRARRTAELTLNPEPNAICHTRSPRATPSRASIQASTYQMEADDVLP